MTIKAIYKVEDDRNEYETEQQAQVAECLQEPGAFLTQDEKLYIAKAITAKYFLRPILKTETVVVSQAELDKRELDSYGPSA